MSETIDTYGPLHMFKYRGGAPWVPALSAEDAQRIVLRENRTTAQEYALEDFVQIPDDEPFTLYFEDEPKGLEIDCQCPPEDIEDETYCVNCGDRWAVSLPAAEWANMKGRHAPEPVIGEFQS